MPDVCATSCPSMHCLARTARRSNITNYEFTSFPTPGTYLPFQSVISIIDSERTHQLSNPDIIRESCKLYDSNCVDLGKVEPCKPDEVRCLMSGACLSPEWRCNGVNDCGFWEDEVNCQGIFPKTPYFNTMLRVFPEGNFINLFATKVGSVNLIKFH